MTASSPAKPPETSLLEDIFRAGRYYLRGGRGLLALAGITIAAGLALNWTWLAAAGITPILVAALPCVAMCAVGVCCMRPGSSQSSPAPPDSTEPSEFPTGKDE